jgi:hypothetical protein
LLWNLRRPFGQAFVSLFVLKSEVLKSERNGQAVQLLSAAEALVERSGTVGWGSGPALLPVGLRSVVDSGHENRKFGESQTKRAARTIDQVDTAQSIPTTPKCREMNDRVLSMVQRTKPEIIVLEGIWSANFDELAKNGR